MARKLLLVIDMQKDFVTGVLGSESAAAIVGRVKEKIEGYRKAGQPVWFTMDTHLDTDYSADNKTRESQIIPKHCVRGSEGWQVVSELLPYAEIRVEKPSFLSLDLAEKIKKELGEEVELELCGVCTDICVVSNALMLRGAFPHSAITVDSTCCAATTPANHQAALDVMKSCLVDII